VQKNHLKRLLINNFKIMDDYTEEKILVKNKNRGANYISNIILTTNCFKELCMISQNERAKNILKQYAIIENIIRDYYEHILLDKLKVYTNI
jgi:phage anti-repressor protein